MIDLLAMVLSRISVVLFTIFTLVMGVILVSTIWCFYIEYPIEKLREEENLA